MPTLTYGIVASADDAFETAGTVSIVDVGSDVDATNEWYGFRFREVRIPVGATITAASLSMVPFQAGDEPDHPIFGIDEDNTGVFTTDASNISGRARTTATATWSNSNLGAPASADTRFTTPDLATLVQEIVDRVGWASGNAMGFVVQGSASATRDLGVRQFDSFSDSALTAQLSVTFTPADGTTAISLQVSFSADDAQEAAGTVTINGTTLTSDATTEWIGLRWRNVLIPQGAVIDTASLYVMPTGTTEDEPDHPIFAEDADNAAVFTTAASSLSGRSRTTATATWSSADLGAAAPSGGIFYQSPELKTLIQEVVDRAGWVPGSAMALLIQGSADGARDLSIEAFDGTSSRAAKLEIIYQGDPVSQGGKGSGGKGKGGQTPGPGEPPKKPLRTSLSKSWKWDRGWR